MMQARQIDGRPDTSFARSRSFGLDVTCRLCKVDGGPGTSFAQCCSFKMYVTGLPSMNANGESEAGTALPLLYIMSRAIQQQYSGCCGENKRCKKGRASAAVQTEGLLL